MQQSKKYLSAIVVLALVFISGQAISSTIKLNPIKPVANQPLTDEQQAILAVRTVKASVVNIVGKYNQAGAAANPGSGFNINAVPNIEVSGTGFIIQSDGLIVTNNHVIDDTSLAFTVILPDGTEYPAKIFGQDKFDDIALLKIDAKGLTAVKLGDSGALETGQTVFAIGNSLGRYQSTVTRGVVSGLSRALSENDSLPTFHDWIQTDAAINLGNSGGPLINLAGEVIGMNTLVDTSGDSLGFALPVNTIKDAVSQLKTFGHVSRPYLGVQFAAIDAALQLSQNLPVKNGALVVSVVDGGPAKASGVMAGDIITGLDNNTVDQQHTLDTIIQKYQAGNQITLKILRNGKELDLPVVVGQLK